MPVATTQSRFEIRAEAIHRAGDGTLISQQVTTPLPKMPEPPEVPDPNCHPCIYKYIKDFDKWAKECRKLMEGHRKMLEYHHRRVVFAEKYRNEIIPEKYRTGEPSPTTGQEAKEEMRLLKRLEKEVKNGSRRSR